MKRDEKIKQAFNFFVAHAQNGESFKLDDLIKASGWTEQTAKIYLSKKFSELVKETNGAYHVIPEFLRVRFEEFKDLHRQKQTIFTEFVRMAPQKVLMYEFFMPLSQEYRLREALDNLFYKDTVEQRIKEIGVPIVRSALNLKNIKTDEDVIQFVVQFIDDTIGGYSLSLVNGRFRAKPLATRSDVAMTPYSEGHYIVDEITATVRFILPVIVDEESLVQIGLFEPAENIVNTDERAEQMRWLFLNFFAEAVTRLAGKEDEIWLLESGMRSALYRWVRKSE